MTKSDAISRDSFARASLYRKRVYTIGETCTECGQVKKTKNGKNFLFQYAWISDSIVATNRISWSKGFCRMLSGLQFIA